MTPETASRLIELNLRFYQEFGKEFSATRRRLQPGVQRLLPQLYPVEALLDLGCGNGELARALARGGFAGRYFGLDFSRPLLRETEGLPPNFSFLEASLTTSDWDQVVPLTGFSIVTAFAVLHHIPSQAFRLMLLRKVWALLVPAGLFIHSEWQFLSSEKWRRRIQPWSDAGLTEAEIDPGDYLLDWRGGTSAQARRGLRYVHHFDEAELNWLAEATGFKVVETFYSDGENNHLGLYQIWTKR